MFAQNIQQHAIQEKFPKLSDHLKCLEVGEFCNNCYVAMKAPQAKLEKKKINMHKNVSTQG